MLRVIVIGGGAAGFFAAINVAEINPDVEVIILEKSNKLLAKVLVSGGGRCNVTHACFDNGLLVKNYPRGEKELRGAFNKFTTEDTIVWFKQCGVTLKTEEDGRMFPVTDNSETIANCLLKAANDLNIKIKTGVSVKEIIVQPDKSFSLKTDTEYTPHCDKLIIASGGNPKNENYNWLRKVGHTIVPPVPSLFTFNIPNNEITELMGVSVPNAKIKIGNTKLEIEGPLLVTHWGLSGPVVLKSSAWGARILHDMNYDFTAFINWLPAYKEEELRNILLEYKNNNAPKNVFGNSPLDLPKRLWELFLRKATISETSRWANVNKKQINTLINILLNDAYHVKGKTTFKEEFVTCGGISLKEVDFSTMQSKIVPNLYFAGEVLDIDGVTGGFNFQNAWTTAWIAANAIK
ncbi:MAG TPA: NAD(P)/FAD-dependent oxidoreductase [Bacteroidia bacterium]|nr:NAD(P)/FAD-dependent oxidoreductase [Bacteroidia bacterium]